MRLDIYRRPENGGRYSYLAVPEGRRIPDEANAVDWETEHKSLDCAEDDAALERYMIDRPTQQIQDKGYAITSMQKLGMPGQNGAR